MKFIKNPVFFFIVFWIILSCEGSNKIVPGGQEILSPQEELASFQVLDGFEIELIASEEDGIKNPVQIAFDDAGNMWTQTATMYPLDPFQDIQWNDLLALMDDSVTQSTNEDFQRVKSLYLGESKGDDKILILSDFYSNPKNKKVRTWESGLTIPMSILPYKTGAYIAQGSEIFYLDDPDGANKATDRTPLLTGFGFTDTHTMPHLLTWGPGGWIYFSHGALNKGEAKSYISGSSEYFNYSKIGRFSFDGREIELVSAGLNNIWGFVLRGNGQWYGIEANDLSYSVVPMEPGTAYPGIGNDKLHEYQPFFPTLHDFRVGGSGLSGLAFDDDESGSFPEFWKDVAFLANPITSSINCVRIERNSDGTVTAEHLPDLLKSGDKNFRPVNITFGPDGALYIVDWYNKIISHNEVPTSHPDRDKEHGRIWRIKHKSQKPQDIINFYNLKDDELINFIASPKIWEKRAAWHQIAERQLKGNDFMKSKLIDIVENNEIAESGRIHALWALEEISSELPSSFISIMNQSGEVDNLRREIVRSLASFGFNEERNASVFSDLISDPNPMIRSQVLRTLSEVGIGDEETLKILLLASKPDIEGNELGGSYERKFERYLALRALEKSPDQIYAFLRGNEDFNLFPIENRLWAIQAIPKNKRIQLLLKYWPTAKLAELDESQFVWMSKLIDDNRVYKIFYEIIDDRKNLYRYLDYGLNNIQLIYSKNAAKLFGNIVNGYLFGRNEVNPEILVKALRLSNELDARIKGDLVYDFISEDNENLNLSIIRALKKDLVSNQNYLLQISNDESKSLKIRLSAINGLAEIHFQKAVEISLDVFPNLNSIEQEQFVNELSYSVAGAKILGELDETGYINYDIIPLSVAERINELSGDDSNVSNIFKHVLEIEAEKRQKLEENFSNYVLFAEEMKGNTVSGKVIFENTCLSCHSLGSKGFDIAPALDGSANRDSESLLTAIVYPDAAIESGYQVYRVYRKDRSFVEGYLYSKDNNGVTIAMMGGNKVFVPGTEIAAEDFVANKSFMPSGLLDNMSMEQINDLLTYIKILK